MTVREEGIYLTISEMENRIIFPIVGMVCPEPFCNTPIFIRYRSLVQQWKTVHTATIDIYKCQICRKSFTRRPDANRHLRNCHRTDIDLINIDNIYFDQMVDRIYPTKLQLNRANSSDTEAPFLDLNLCISNGTVSTKIYDKRDDFDFDIVNFPFLDGDVSRRTSYGVYISQLIRFARASSNLNDFNYRNKALTAKLLRQGYRYFKLRRAFSKFYRRLVRKI